MSLSQSVKNRIKRKPDMWVFSALDFADLGDRGAVDRVLSRLYKDGIVIRVYQGIYMKPYQSKLFPDMKAVAPINDVLSVMAKKDNVVITDTNTHATNILGLTNVVQAKPVYLTTGKTRDINIDGVQVKLKNMGGKLSQWVKSPAFAAVQAMTWLGKDMFDNNPDLKFKLWKNIPSKAQYDLVRHQKRLPVWTQKLIKDVA